jgi:hypothetical protein
MKKTYYLFLIILVTALLLSLIGCTGTTVTVVEAPFTATQTTTTTASVPSTIATVQSMGVGFDFSNNGAPILDVHLIPSTRAIANEQYTVDLYDEGNFRDSTIVSWNQPEINVSDSAEVKFSLSQTEYNACYGKDVSGVFSVTISATPVIISPTVTYTPTPVTIDTTPYFNITSPQDGDIWHVGNTVTIQWTSENIPTSTMLNVDLVTNAGTVNHLIGTTKNTGSFTWVVTNIFMGIDIIFSLDIAGGGYGENVVTITIIP